MKVYSIIFLIILTTIIIFPSAHAQISSVGSNQKSIEVTLSQTGEMHVIHVIKKLGIPSQIDLLDGKRSNLTVQDQNGNDINYGQVANDDFVMVLPSNDEAVIEYDLANELILKDDVWTLDFFYLDSVSFIFPDQVDLVFVDGKPAYLGEKNGILCHGCKMVLEYSFDQPKFFEIIKIEDREFLIEFRTLAKISQFSFDPSKGFNFEVMGENNFVTTIVPVDLLSDPYQIFLDEEKVFFHKNFNNETHVWLNMRPQNSGEVSIIGTVVPEIGALPEEQIRPEFLVIGVIIIGVVIAGVFFFKRKK